MKVTMKQLDDRIRELEMLVDGLTYGNVPITAQFFQDLRLYGLKEADAYLRQNIKNEQVDWSHYNKFLKSVGL